MKIRCPLCQTVYAVSLEVAPGQRLQCTCGHKFPFNAESAVVEPEGSGAVPYTLCRGCESRLDTISLWPGQSFICPLCKTRNVVGEGSTVTTDEDSGSDPSDINDAELNSQRDLVAGDIVAHCRIVKKLGNGAMGAVYLAMHTTLDIPVVMKVLLGRFLKKPEFKARFYREARTAAKLDHPNVVRVLDCGEEKGLLYLVMEYVDGGSAKDLLAREGKLSSEMVVGIAKCVCRALIAAARIEIIHRDIKPDNIMRTTDGSFKLSDLGLAKTISRGARDAALTLDRTPLGTPHYMSPEQALDARSCDARSDIYSLGATMYHLLCGRPPFDAPTSSQVLRKHMNGTCPPPSKLNNEVPAKLDEIIGKAMMKRPEYRYASAEEMLLALRDLFDDDDSVSAGADRTVSIMVYLLVGLALSATVLALLLAMFRS